MVESGAGAPHADFLGRWQAASGWLPRTSLRNLAAGLVVLAAVLSVVLTFDRGWLPHDDGYLAWSAERVLSGDTPHVDYDEIYTGGLSYLNAATFRVLGPSLRALRIPLLILFLLFVASVYAVSRRCLSRPASAATVAIVVCLGPLLTPTPMPTLYNLYLGSFALYCLLRYSESNSSSWIACSGFLTGLSTLIKVSGLYVLMGLALSVVAMHPPKTKRDKGLRLAVLIGSAASSTILIRPALTVSRLFVLLMPIYVAVWALSRLRPPRSRQGSGLATELSWLSVGFAAPLAAFAIVFAARGHLSAVLAGVAGMASKVSGLLLLDTQPLATLLVPVGLLLVYGILSRVAAPKGLPAEIAAFLIFTLGWYLVHPRSQLLAIHQVLNWIVPISAFVLWRWGRRLDPDSASHVLGAVLVAFAACFQLVKFPSANQWQVAYTVPLGIMAILVLANHFPSRAKVATFTVLASFGLVFGLARVNGQIYSSTTVGLSVPYIDLESDRADIKVLQVHWYYNEIDPRIEDHAVLFATPDLPEVYFLNGLPSNGRGVFPILSEALRPGTSEVSEYQEANPSVVVLNTEPVVSELDSRLVRHVVSDCGAGTLIGRLRLFECGASP